VVPVNAAQFTHSTHLADTTWVIDVSSRARPVVFLRYGICNCSSERGTSHMMVSNRVMWAVLVVAAGAGLAAVLMPPARSRRRANEDDQSSRVDEASEDSFPASDPPSFSADLGAQAVSGITNNE